MMGDAGMPQDVGNLFELAVFWEKLEFLKY